MHSSYELNISHNSPDENWDEFLMRIPGDHYTQTSLWAQVNETLGWQVLRVMLLKDDKIVAGAQLQYKKPESVSFMAYLIKGPVFSMNEPNLHESFLTELLRIARQTQICFIALQPPINANWLNQLPRLDFRLSDIKMEPTATILLDLNFDPETLLNNMKARTRYNIRLSKSKGIISREGTADDLNTFYNLLELTSQRQQFEILPKQFFTNMWEVFNPRNQIKIFLSEYEGLIVSAQLALIFGDTVVNKMSVWSGQHANRKPNEALYWNLILWGKRNGYRYINLEGIDRDVALALINNEPIPNTLKHSTTSFKLGFGGRVVLLPRVYEHIFNRAIRQLHDSILIDPDKFMLD